MHRLEGPCGRQAGSSLVIGGDGSDNHYQHKTGTTGEGERVSEVSEI